MLIQKINTSISKVDNKKQECQMAYNPMINSNTDISVVVHLRKMVIWSMYMATGLSTKYSTVVAEEKCNKR